MTDETTEQQRADALKTQRAVLNEANLLSAEGLAPQEIVAGMGAAIADVIATHWGQEAVGRWFHKQGLMMLELHRRLN